MRVAFFGSSRFSCLVFSRLMASSHTVAAVITQPDQPAGRRLELRPTEMCADAEHCGLPVLKPERVRNNPQFRRELAAHHPEALLVASFGQLISPKVLELTEWPLNVHPSLLPKLRGASPIRTALLQGLRLTGCCVMRMTPQLDNGDVLCRGELEVGAGWNYERLETELGELGGLLGVAALDAVAGGTAHCGPQDHSQATYCRAYTRQDTRLDWSRSAAELASFICAWDPDMGALTELPDGGALKIWRAEADALQVGAAWKGSPPVPGTVLAVSKRAFWAGTGEGVLRVDELQLASKPRVNAASFLAGHRLTPGQVLGRTNKDVRGITP
jgi:methionyl-tRNA formyltransferase